MKCHQLWGKIIVKVLVCSKNISLSIQSSAYLLQDIRSLVANSNSYKKPSLVNDSLCKWVIYGTYGTVTWQCYHIKMDQNGFEDSCDFTDPLEDRSNQSPWEQMCPVLLSSAFDLRGDGVMHTLALLLNVTAGLRRWKHLVLRLQRCFAVPLPQALCSAWLPHLSLA